MLFGKQMSGTVVGKLYDNLKIALEDIHNKHRTRSEQKLIGIVDDYYKKCTDDYVTCGAIQLDKNCALQMVLWNCIYYNFYEQEVNIVYSNYQVIILTCCLYRYLHQQFLIHW